MSFAVTLRITNDYVAGLLCSGFEGEFSRQWALVKAKEAPRRDALFKDKGWLKYPLYSYPLGAGGFIKVEDRLEGKTYKLDRRSIERGLKRMAKGNPYQFGLLVCEEGDAITGDAFLQYCTLGREVYG